MVVIDDAIVGHGMLFQMADLEALNAISIEIVQPDLAVRLYGERGRHGALILRTQAPSQAREALKAIPGNNGRSGKDRLTVIDGVAVGYGMEAVGTFLDAAGRTLVNMTIVQGQAAAPYGQQGANGVVMVTTRPRK